MPKPRKRYGIGEWYGRLFYRLTPKERQEINEQRLLGGSHTPPCPFKPMIGGHLQICDKEGGVCSLKQYVEIGDGLAVPSSETTDCLVITCPARFLQERVVEKWAGEILLDTPDPEILPEIGFLRRDRKSPMSGDDPDGVSRSDKKVGRIDEVLVAPNVEPMRWCPVEHQAVYFSGAKMEDEFQRAVENLSMSPHFPVGRRRPDFRSSGPKRLMPQLQIKVPTLSRWGKRTGVVVDEAFFGSLGEMEEVSEVSNCDIAWFVVSLREEHGDAKLARRSVHFTTLAKAVEGLTAGKPVTQVEFEAMIRLKRDDLKKLQARAQALPPEAKIDLG